MSEEEKKSLLRVVRDHPVMTVLTVACIVIGAVVGIYVFPEQWHVARSIVLGALLGLWCALLIIGWRALTSLGETEG